MQLSLFRLLSEISHEEDFILQLKESYDEFALEILIRLQQETNHTKLYYSLGFILLELIEIGKQLWKRNEKEVLKTAIKAIGLIEISKQVLEWRVTAPNNKVQCVQENKLFYSDNTLFKQLLEDNFPEKEELERSTFNLPRVRMTWTGNKVDLVELIYAWEASGSFNYGKVSIKDIVAYIEVVFNIHLGDYYNTFKELRNRVKRTAFLEKLMRILRDRMDEMDRKK